jgi:6-pyruvoyl-tetrahydropterin synthase
MVCDLAELDSFMERAVLAPLDHQDLNSLPEFAGTVPTTENLCVKIHHIIKNGFSAATLERTRVEETSKNSFEFREAGTRFF